jgi:hypothetical protein
LAESFLQIFYAVYEASEGNETQDLPCLQMFKFRLCVGFTPNVPFNYMPFLASATISAAPCCGILSVYPQTWYIYSMYPKLHFIHQDIVGALYGSCAIDKTLPKELSDNLFAQVVYMALSDCACDCAWYKMLFSELDKPIDFIPLYGDSKGAIFNAQNPITQKGIKHIEIQ